MDLQKIFKFCYNVFLFFSTENDSAARQHSIHSFLFHDDNYQTELHGIGK